ncbi:MaoC family dehydratase N-terminal domain-containing protein [Thermodesulfovibrionales bacterium]|nr:MaoC family dehydratase N-terminal domain-containing protein [Thermodesulfovibrionales bacterium]
MIDAKFIDRKYPPVTYEVCKEKIKEYARAVGDLNPLYVDEEQAKSSQYGRIIAPPLFAAIYAREALENWIFDSELSLNLLMMVHGEQEFEFFKVVKAGDVITTEGRIAEIHEKKGLDFISLETISTNQQGEVVTMAIWKMVIRR